MDTARRWAFVEAAIRAAAGESSSPLVVLNEGQGQPQLILVHGAGGSIANFPALARELPPERPFWALAGRVWTHPEALPDTLVDVARLYAELVIQAKPAEGYVLAGWSFGGLVALEMARFLRASGHAPHRLLVLDMYWGIAERARAELFVAIMESIGSTIREEAAFREVGREVVARCPDPAERLPLAVELLRERRLLPAEKEIPLVTFYRHSIRLMRGYQAPSEPYAGETLLVRCAESFFRDGQEDYGWHALATRVTTRDLGGGHYSIFRPEHVGDLARLVEESFA